MNTIISNISSLAADFPFFKFSWVRRTCNSAAHVTARLALRLSVREISLVVLLLFNEIAVYQPPKNKKHLLFSSQHFLQLFFVHLGSDIIALKVRLGTIYLVETENFLLKVL